MQKQLHFKSYLFLALLSSTLVVQAQQLDTTFSSDGIVTTDISNSSYEGIEAMAYQSSGKIVALGYTDSDSDNNSDIVVARYNTNGSLDSSFGTNGIAKFNFTNEDGGLGLTVGPDDKIYVVGYMTPNTLLIPLIMRLNPNGSIDTSISFTDAIPIEQMTGLGAGITSIIIQDNGKILLGGAVVDADGDLVNGIVARLNSNGSLDSSFGTSGITLVDLGGIGGLIQKMVVQPNGKIVVVGYNLLDDDYKSDVAVARFNTNGTLDSGFGTGGRVFIDVLEGDYGYDIALQSNGKIVVVGDTYDETNDDFLVARLNTNGALDTSFGGTGVITTDFNTSFDVDEAHAVMLQTDGKIIAAGTAGDGMAMVRYLDNGTIDESFGINGKAIYSYESYITCGSWTPDGKILLAGELNTTDSGANFFLAQIDNSKALGLDKLDKNWVSIYPNPVKDILNIQLKDNSATVLTVYTILGKQVLKRNISQLNTTISLDHLSAGIYLVNINNDKQKFTQKIIKK